MRKQRGPALIAIVARRPRAGLLRSTALQAAAVVVLAAPALAQPAPTARPAGGVVVGGSASIAQTQAQTTVQQGSQRAAIDWRSFDVGSQHTVQYNQPNASAVVLNRVTGPDPSQIAGRIQANGQVVITNQSGVVFHKGAQVDAAGLIVSAAGITPSNFMAGRMVFDQAPKPDAAVTNAGTITVKETGLAALVAPRVANSGVINARMGRAVLAGAETHTVDLYGDGLLAIDVTSQVRQAPRGPDGKPVTALVTNTGTIIADGGSVQITAAAADGIVQNLVQAGGTIRAKGGTVVMAGVGGSLRIEGDVNVGAGGTVTASATDTVTVAAPARIAASSGTVNIGNRATAAVKVEAGARISASGRGSGNGGTVNVISNGATSVDGRIAARGGRTGGNGGQVEVSGKTVGLTGVVDTAAPKGRAGSVLIDPTDITISDHGGSGTVITPASLQAMTGDITLQADNSIVASSSVTLNNNGQLSNVNQSLTLNAGNFIRVDAGVTLDVIGSLFLQAGAGGVSLLGNVTPRSTQGLVFNTTGAVTQGPGSIITAAAVHGTVGSADLTSAVNQISSAGYNSFGFDPTAPFTATAGDIAVSSAAPLTIQGGYFTAGVVVPNGRSMTFASDSISVVAPPYGNVAASAPGGTITLKPLTATRPIEVTSGTPTAGTLSLQANTLQYLRAPTLGLGTPTGGAITLARDGTTVDFGALGFTTVRLQSAGNIGQVGSVGIVNVDATGANIDLSNGGNTIGAVTQLVSGNGALLHTNGTLTVNGPITGPGQVSLSSTSTMTLNASITGGTVNLDTYDGMSLFSSGALVQNAGTITGSLLTGQAASATLNQANNIPLGNFSTANDFSFTGQPGIAINGFLSVGTTTTLTTAGAVTQGQSGSLSTDVLAGSAGSLNLPSTSNLINTLGTFTTSSGGYALTTQLNDGTPNRVNGTVTVPNGQTIALITDGIGFQSGGLTAPNGTVSIAPLTDGVGIQVVATGGELGGLVLTQAGLNSITTGTLSIGSATAGPINLGLAGDAISLTGHADTLNLLTAGAVTQGTGASLAVPTLTGSAASVLLGGANAIGTLGTFTTTGGLSLTNAGSLAVAGTVSAGGALSLTTTGAASGLTLAGNVTAGASTLTSGTGGIGQTGGSFTAPSLAVATTGALSQTANGAVLVGTLSGSAGSVNLAGGQNLIPTLGAFTSGGAFTLLAGATPLSITGALNAAGSTVYLGAASVSQTAAGAITAGSLGGNTPGGADFSTATNAVSAISGFGTLGNFALNDGTTALSLTGALSASGTVSLTAGSLTQTAAGVLTAGTLTGTIGGATNLGAATNAVGALGAYSSGGAFTLNDGAAALSITGLLNAGTNAVSLTAGSITETGAGSITAGSLAGSTSGAATLGNTNAIPVLVGFVSGGNFTLNDGATGLTVTGALNAGANTVTLTAGSLAQTAGGAITAGSLTGAIAGAANLGTATNAIAGIGAFTTGPFTLNDGGTALTITGALNAGANTVTLNAGSLGESGAGAITAGTLTGTTTGAVALGGANQVATLGSFTSVGGFSLTDARALTQAGTLSDTSSISLSAAGPLTLGGAVNAPGVTLAATGAVTQSGGAITAGTLAVSGSSASLTQAGNSIVALGSVSTAGDFVLTDARSLTVTGPASSGTSIQLGVTGDLALAGNLGAPNVTLNATGSVSQPGGAVTATTLSGTAGGGFVLGSTTNQVVNLGPVTAASTVLLTDARSLTITGAIDPPDVTLNVTGALAINNAITAGTLTLNVTGAVTQGGGGSIDADTLRGLSGSVVLDTAVRVVTLADFTTTGALTVLDGRALTITGPVTAGSTFTARSTGSMTVAGDITAPAVNLTATATFSTFGAPSPGDILFSGGTLTAPGSGTTLTAAGAIRQTGGSLASTALRGTAGATVSLTSATNRIASVGPFTSTGGFALTSATGLTVASGSTVADTASIDLRTGGALQILGRLQAPNLSLNAAGAITEGPAGTIAATVLTGAAAGATFDNAGNTLTALGPFASTGDFLLNTPSNLGVTGPVSAGPGRTLTLSPASLAIQQGGSLSAPGGTVALAPFQAGAPFILSNFLPASTTNAITASTLQVGNATTGDITVANAFNLPSVSTLALVSGGSITQSGGANITVARLTASGTTVRLDQANAISTLGTSAASGAFTLNTIGTLTVAGTVDGAGGIRLAADGLVLGTTGATGLAGTLRSPGLVNLTATNAITEPNGAILAGSLTGSAGSADLRGANQVPVLAGFSVSGTPGSFALNDIGPLTVTAPVNGANASIGLTTTGALTLQAGIASSAVSLSAASIDQTAGSNAIGLLNVLTTTGDATLLGTVGTLGSAQVPGTLRIANPANASLQVSGPVTAGTLDLAGGDVGFTGAVTAGTLRLAAGNVTQSGGALSLGTLTGTASGVLVLGTAGTAAIGTITNTAAGPLLQIVATRQVTLGGANQARAISVRAAGVTLAGGSLTGNDVTVEATGSGSIAQTGTTAAGPLTGAVSALRLQVHGGRITLDNLVAQNAALVLGLDAGSVLGALNVGSLFVDGLGGGATLSGTVGGRIGFAAAQASGISRFDTAYTLNGCAIASVSCVPIVPPVVPPVVTPTQPVVRIVVPSTIRPDIVILEGVLRPDLFTADLITLDILRNPTDPDFALPNISDRDY